MLGRQVWTLPALLQARAELSPHAPAAWSWEGKGAWVQSTWRQFADEVEAVARGLRALGLRRGDRLGIMAPSAPRWDVLQFAAMATGAVVVGLDPHDTDQRLTQIAAQCGLAAVVAQDETWVDRFGAGCRASLRVVVALGAAISPGTIGFADLARAGSGDPAMAWDLSRADDPALIVFTSGTTGEPKGICYTHRQVCGAAAAILQAFPDIETGSRLACWLPLSNLFQRMINICAVARGAQTYYVDDPRVIMQRVASIAPHVFIGVPRFYEKLHAGIVAAIATKPSWQQALARWALRVGERRARALRSGGKPNWRDAAAASFADRLVLRALRQVLGGEIRYLISGSAPMPGWLLERFHAMGFLVLEAYGMSESIVPVSANRPDRYRFGTVGQPLASTEVRIAGDGELLLRGPGVFAGYIGDADAAGRLDREGFLHSGDYASLDDDGFVTLLGRKSEIFKTSTGRRIAPAIVESHLRQIPYVEHAVVFGANRPVLVAIVAVSAEAMRERLGGRSLEEQPESAAAAIRGDIAAALVDLPAYLHPAGFVLVTRPFSIAGGEITTNLKVRRAHVERAYRDQLEVLFDAVLEGPGAASVRAVGSPGEVFLLGA